MFITSDNQREEESAYVVNIPKSRHGEEGCVKAKKKELQNFEMFDVYEVVSIPDDPKAVIIDTEWVLVEKEIAQSQEYEIKARLCLRGDQEVNKHLIPTDSPTVNKITWKLLLTIAASQGLEVDTQDITRAFLQTEKISREIYVRAPIEANVDKGKCWRLLRPAYGLVDSSRSFFLRLAKGFREEGFKALTFDPATFVLHDEKGNLKVASAQHVDMLMMPYQLALELIWIQYTKR